MADVKIVTPDVVTLQISMSNNELLFSERRFAKDITIMDLKNKLEMITGASSETMRIELYTKDNNLVGPLSDNAACLGSFPVEDSMRLHVIDKFALRSQLEDLSDVPKYEIPDEVYGQKDDTVRQFLIKNKMGQYNEEFQRKKELQEQKERELTSAMIVGSRCKVSVKSAPTRLGTIMFKGDIDGLPGQWVGVKYDEPLGKNDGTCKDKRYFECAPNYGAFVKAVDVIMGDFPEEDYDLNEEI